MNLAACARLRALRKSGRISASVLSSRSSSAVNFPGLKVTLTFMASPAGTQVSLHSKRFFFIDGSELTIRKVKIQQTHAIVKFELHFITKILSVLFMVCLCGATRPLLLSM